MGVKKESLFSEVESLGSVNVNESSIEQSRRESVGTITLTDASETLTKASTENSDLSKEPSEESPKPEQQQQPTIPRHPQYQQNNSRFQSRNDRRFQRRNMTDPLSSASQPASDEKHAIIMNSLIKRNSLNDRTRTNNDGSGQMRVNQTCYLPRANKCGESTSTLMSTDSGVSCEHPVSYSDESISRSPVCAESNSDELRKKSSSLKITNSISSTTSTSSSSSSAALDNCRFYNLKKKELKSLADTNSLDLECFDNTSTDCCVMNGENSLIAEDEFEINPEVVETTASQVDEFYTEHIYQRKILNNIRYNSINNSIVAQNSDPKIYLAKQYRSNDLNNNNNDIINLNESETTHKSNIDTNNVNTTNRFLSHAEILVNQKFSSAQSKFQQPSFTLNSNPSIQKLQQQKRQLVKINSATLTNETLKLSPVALMAMGQESSADFDPTIRSAHNTNSNQPNNLTLDNHHRMILVKLLHTTMDAT